MPAELIDRKGQPTEISHTHFPEIFNAIHPLVSGFKTDRKVVTIMANALVDGLVPVFKAAVDSANATALKIKGATSGKDEKIQAILSTSDDERIVKWREQDANVRAQIMDAEKRLAESKVKVSEIAETLLTESDDFDVEKGKAEFLTARQEITSLRKTLLMLLKNDESALEKILNDAGVVEVLSLRGSGGKTSGAPGKRKPRLESATVNGENVEKPTFTTLAQKIGVDVDTLKSAAFKAADTEDLSGDKAGQEITFTVANKKSETVTVVIVPKASAAASTDSEDSEKSEDEKSE